MTNYQETLLNAQSNADLSRLTELTEFWKVPYATSLKDTNLAFSSGSPSDKSDVWKRTVVISPRGFADAQTLADRFGVKVCQTHADLTLPISNSEALGLKTDIYEFAGSQIKPALSFNNYNLLARVNRTNTYLLCVDVIDEYDKWLYQNLDDHPSKIFSTMARLPIPYSIVPGSLRDWSLRRSYKDAGSTIKDNAPVDFIRFLFLAALAVTSPGPIPRIAFWPRNKRYVTIISHDVETRDGLRRGTRQLLQIERRLQVKSTWNIPSDRYELDRDAIREIVAEGGSIGAHDTKHDGRLILSPFKDKVDRLEHARQKLQKISGTRVRGFRAPLLQHDRELLTALGHAGYEYDSSTPTFETLSPTSMRAHGVGTVFPFQFETILEIPVSLPQDHQLTRIAKLSTSEAANRILQETQHVKNLGGVCTLLVHPDYEYGRKENSDDYYRILSHYTNDRDCEVTTMETLVKWWKQRMGSKIDLSTGTPRLIESSDWEGAFEKPSIELVTGFGPHGFDLENIAT